MTGAGDSVSEMSSALDDAQLSGLVFDGRYEVRDRIGRGGMGDVYRAWQRTLEREVAIKVIRPERMTHPDARRLFIREVRACTRLRHPNTITVFDYGEAPSGLVWFSMELLEGETLGSILAREGRLPWERLTRLAIQVCEALAAAGEARIVHRDLKPENIYLSRLPGGSEHVTVLDFGLAKSIEPDASRLSNSKLVCGTAAYMSPESATRAPMDGRSDLYSLGIIMYECLAGRRPFESEDLVPLLLAHAQEPAPALRPIAPPDVPSALLGLVERLLEKRPEDRPRTAMDVRDRLQSLARSGSTEPESTGAIALPSPRARLRRGVVATGATVMASLILSLWLVAPAAEAIVEPQRPQPAVSTTNAPPAVASSPAVVAPAPSVIVRRPADTETVRQQRTLSDGRIGVTVPAVADPGAARRRRPTARGTTSVLKPY